MPSAGQWGVGIGTGALTGAGAGAFLGPIGAGVGGALGAGAGFLSTLLSASDEAKEKKRQLDAYNAQQAQALEAYKRDQQKSAEDDWAQRYAAITGIGNDPMYIATHAKSYDPVQATADFNAHAGAPPTFPDDPTPNYAGLISSAGQLGSTLGAASRQSDAAAKLDELMQQRKAAADAGNESAWAGFYANGGSGFY